MFEENNLIVSEQYTRNPIRLLFGLVVMQLLHLIQLFSISFIEYDWRNLFHSDLEICNNFI